MPSKASVVSYLHDCYRDDYSRMALWSVFHKQVENKIFFSGREAVFSRRSQRLPLPQDEGLALKKKAGLYRKEKTPVYAAFFLAGHAPDQSGQAKPVAAPLWMVPLELTIEQGACWAIPRMEKPFINGGVLEQLCENGDELADALSEVFARGKASQLGADFLSCFAEHGLTLADTALTDDTLLLDRVALRKKMRLMEKRGALAVFPAAVAALLPKPSGARGVLNELEEMSRGHVFSAPLERLLNNAPSMPLAKPRLGHASVPALLSRAQSDIVHAASSRELSVVIGPPGTGKSFTIAAIAVEHFRRGESVLIASKMNHAVDVVAEKIRAMVGLDHFMVRGGRKQYMRNLKQRLQGYLRGMLPVSKTNRYLTSLQKTVMRLDTEIDALSYALGNHCQQETTWGAQLAKGDAGFFDFFRRQYIRYRSQQKDPLWKTMRRLHLALQKRVRQAGELTRKSYDQRLREVFRDHRPAIRHFLKGLRARTGSKQEEWFDAVDFQHILKAFPVWLSDFASVGEVLPLERELFDVAIIDEASQCDMASCLPVIQRAKRLVVIGDPQQLHHLSFLATGKQNSHAQQYGLSEAQRQLFDYRQRGVLALAEDRIARGERAFFLNEHFRSQPEIIGFSNRQFYNNALHVMTEKPGRRGTPAVSVIHGEGVREGNGANPKEAARVIEALAALLRQPVPPRQTQAPSVGILSPFRAQADLLSDLVAKRFDLKDLQNHQILVGTAHSFQGEERDHMLLSLGLDRNYHSGSLRFLERGGVFNVCITRARVSQRIFLSLAASDLPRQSLLARYVADVANLGEDLTDPAGPAPDGPQDNPSDATFDAFAQEVATVLSERGFSVLVGYAMTGLVLDLVIFKKGVSLGIDLIGYPGEFEANFPLERYHMLNRAGFPLFPLSYSAWVFDREACIKAISGSYQRARRNRGAKA